MDEASWELYPISHFHGKFAPFRPVSSQNDEHDMLDEDSVSSISLENVLPDDILERILSYLPVACMVRAASVCKRWYGIVTSRRHIWAHKLQQKPWYFMFTCSDAAAGYAYDPIFRKWYNLDLPCIEKSNWFVSSSCGLVCFMDNDRSKIFVCNPITRNWRKLVTPPGAQFPDYCALAMSVNREFQSYTVVVAKSKQVPCDFLQWDFSINIYDSKTRLWMTTITEVLMGWRGGDECVICNGILYCLIYSAGLVGGTDIRHGLIMYDLSSRSSHTSLMRTAVPVPCPLTCGRLMNLNDRLVMVGGIGKHDRPDIIKGIGIWELLHKKEWREVAKMPYKFFQGFGEFDDVFASSGADDLIYIQSYGAPALLVFDISQKQWKWSLKCPVTKRFPLQLFTGFCFEPRLEVTS